VGEDVERLRRRLPLLDYLRQHNWTGRPAGRSEFVGLCPLHEETRPSFYVNTRKNVFYCHGCGQGGDLIRFVQLSRHLSFRQSLACLDARITSEADSTAVLEQAAAFYQQQLDNYPAPNGPIKTSGPLAQEALKSTVAFNRIGISRRDSRPPAEALDRAASRLEHRLDKTKHSAIGYLLGH
jgi:DNA primase